MEGLVNEELAWVVAVARDLDLVEVVVLKIVVDQ